MSTYILVGCGECMAIHEGELFLIIIESAKDQRNAWEILSKLMKMRTANASGNNIGCHVDSMVMDSALLLSMTFRNHVLILKESLRALGGYPISGGIWCHIDRLHLAGKLSSGPCGICSTLCLPLPELLI